MEPVSLTVLGAIGSIASILNHGSDLVKKFRKRRKERKKAKENKALQKSIHASHARNRQAYDDAVRLLGQGFGYDDDISKSQFRLTSSKMRRWKDLVLVSSRDEIAIIFPKAVLLRSMSDEIQSSVRNDLTGLSQRMMQAAPLRNIAFNDPRIWDGPSIGGNCSSRIGLYPSSRSADDYLPLTVIRDVRYFPPCTNPDLGQDPSGLTTCYGCGWKGAVYFDILINLVYVLSPLAVTVSHARGRDGKFICRVCSAMKDLHGLSLCLAQHNVPQVIRVYGSDSLRPRIEWQPQGCACWGL